MRPFFDIAIDAKAVISSKIISAKVVLVLTPPKFSILSFNVLKKFLNSAVVPAKCSSIDFAGLGFLFIELSIPSILSIDNTYNGDAAVTQFRMKTNATAVTAMTILGTSQVLIGTTTAIFNSQVKFSKYFPLTSPALISAVK